MNEQIEKLAEQARQYAWVNETHWSAGPEREALFEQKFAELIVKKCAELASEETSLPYDSYSEKIKKHFGVEE